MEEKKSLTYERSGYGYSRQYFDFAFENPDKVTPAHGLLYFWLVELNNRLGWKEKFGLPTVYSMEVLGLKSYNTYKKALNDLIEWGLVKLIAKAKNQHTSNIIALSNFNKAQYKALDKALTKHVTKQNDIDKQVNNETSETIETPLPDKPADEKLDFIDSIIAEFLKTYPHYETLTPGVERSMAGKLLRFFKKKYPGLDEEGMLLKLSEFFESCKTIQDPWYKANMSLTTMVTKYNTIQAMLTDDSGKQDLTNMEYEGGLK